MATVEPLRKVNTVWSISMSSDAPYESALNTRSNRISGTYILRILFVFETYGKE